MSSPAENQANAPTGPMATEPALTLGDLFANKLMLRQIIGAVITLLVMGGATITDTVGDRLTDSIYVIAPVAFLLYNLIVSRITAIKQAQATREAVYSPATVSRIAETSAATGLPVIAPPPADDILSTNAATMLKQRYAGSQTPPRG